MFSTQQSRTRPCSVRLIIVASLAVACQLTASDRLEHPLLQAIRRGDHELVESLLREGTPANVRASDGTTPLLLAAAHASPRTVELLLEHGADPGAANERGATPLLWGAGDPEKVKLLLAHGADPNARASSGQTPLLAAAGYAGGAASVVALLDAGAEIDARNSGGFSALSYAVTSGSLETARVLLDRGADVNPSRDQPRRLRSPLLSAAAEAGDPALVELLLAHGADPNGSDTTFYSHPLNAALLTEQPEIARLLLEAGCDPTRPTVAGKVPPIVLSAYTETDDSSVARLLVAKGVDAGARNARGESALDWARRRGHRDLIAFFESMSVPAADDARDRKEMPRREIDLHAGNRDRLVTTSVQRSLALLQSSSDVFLQNRESCVSCHHQNLPGVAMAWARDRGFRVDDGAIERMIERQVKNWTPRAEYVYEMQHRFPVPPRFLGWGLLAFGALGYPPDALTEAVVWYVAALQRPEGHWRPGSLRPPLGGNEVVATALCVRALRDFPLAGRRDEISERVERAASWLRKFEAATHQDLVYKLLGLGWAGTPPDELETLTAELLALQRQDGGWAQLPGLESDAWATGQSLVALATAGGLPTTSPAYQRGLEFLLRTQFDDGSWFVRTRAWPFQPHFDGGFPHGRDQWISAPATAWATMAMVLAVEPFSEVVLRPPEGAAVDARSNEERTPPDSSGAPGTREANAPRADGGSIDFATQVKPVLERSCAGCHSGEKPKASFRVTSRAALLEGGESGVAAVVPGHGATSPLVRFVSDRVEDLEMPPLAQRGRFPPLSTAEIAALEAWIGAGAPWPEGVELSPPRD